jgi:hypothetical protein
MPTHMHPSRFRFTCRSSSQIMGLVIPARCLGQTRNRQVPRAPSHASGVTRRAEVSSTSSEGVTPPSSLIRTHAPDQNPPYRFRIPLYGRSLQVAVRPCWKLALPDVISTACVKALGPVPRHVPFDPVRLDALASRVDASIDGHRPHH